jgi:acyl-coenzyme A synthetase/AMP-(fatty) acid ligase
MSFVPLSRIFPAAYRDDHVIAVRQGQALTFAALRADAAAATQRLKQAGCKRGALVCRDSYWFIVGMLALMQAKADIVFPANAQPGTLSALSGSHDGLVTDDPSLPERLLLLPEAAECSTAGLAPVEAAACRLEFFTSGSAGQSKKIVRTLAQLEIEAQTFHGLWAATVGDAAAFTTVSHQHIYGISFKLLWPIMTGRPFCAATHEYWESLFAELSPGAVVVSSPAHLTRLGGLAPLPAARRPRMILSAGAPLPLAAAQDAERVLGVLPTEIYGSTETGAIATRRPSSAGVPWQLLPGNRIRLGEDERLELQSAYVDPDDWFATADRIDLHADGRFTLRGRLDGVAKIEGKRIGLAAIARALETLPFVEAAEVTVVRDDRDQLAAVVVLTALGRAALSDKGAFRLTRLLRRQLAVTQEAAGLPRRWRFVEAMPTGPMGKRQASAIAALFREHCDG